VVVEPEKAGTDVAESCDGSGRVLVDDYVSIFPPRRVANVVALVFNGPVPANMIMKVGSGHFILGSTESFSSCGGFVVL
jgi:hypothetical protein